ncbi:MAG: hypothetical protein WBG70_24585 [Spirulinaceae cyanobacterium]
MSSTEEEDRHPERIVLKFKITSVYNTLSTNNLLIKYFHKRWTDKRDRKKEITKCLKARVSPLALLERYKQEGVLNQEKKVGRVVNEAMQSVAQLNSFIDEIRERIKDELDIDISGAKLSLKVNSEPDRDSESNGHFSTPTAQEEEENEEAEMPDSNFQSLDSLMF